MLSDQTPKWCNDKNKSRSTSLLEEMAGTLVRHGGLSSGDVCILWGWTLWSFGCRWAGLEGWGAGHSRTKRAREKKTRETRDWRGGRKLATNICCLSVPSLAGSGNPHIRCTAAAVSTQALSNTYTMALLSQTKLERWLWKETGSPQSQRCQDRVAEHSLIKHTHVHAHAHTWMNRKRARAVASNPRNLWRLWCWSTHTTLSDKLWYELTNFYRLLICWLLSLWWIIGAGCEILICSCQTLELSNTVGDEKYILCAFFWSTMNLKYSEIITFWCLRVLHFQTVSHPVAKISNTWDV